MAAQFSFDVDPVRSLVRIRMAGFFEAADIARFVAARDDAFQRLRRNERRLLTLVDIRDMHIQSQASVAEFQQILSGPGIKSWRLGFVVAKSLARHQIRRAAEGRNAAYFATTE